MKIISNVVLLVCGLLVFGCPQRDANVKSNERDVSRWPEINTAAPDPEVEKKIEAILSGMSLDRKIGQMLQVEINSFTSDEMKKYRFGSVLNGGGGWPGKKKNASISEWVALADSIWTDCVAEMNDPIPPLWGTDAVHGHGNVRGATLFPHNIGLGAARDTALLYRIARVTAKEVAVTGIDWNFAPTVAVVRNDRWGRTYESYAESPDIVAAYAGRYVAGLQGEFSDRNVLATAKHYIADGGTRNGIDRGNTVVSEQELVDLHAAGYIAALKAGVQTIMVSYSSWQGTRMHEHTYLLTEVLKKRMGFDGFIISDWNAIELVDGCSKSSCPQAINAGIDMFMVPFHDDWMAFVNNVTEQVESGEVPMSRIDDAVSRILRVKLSVGMFEKPSPGKRTHAGKAELVGAPEHRALAREAVRKSLVLLKNNNDLLPLSRDVRILVTGCGADSIAMQAGGWSITWQGTGNTNSDYTGATSILDGIKAVADRVTFDPAGESIGRRQYDVAVAVIGERPYAEYKGDISGGLTLEHANNYPEDLVLLKRLKAAKIPVATVFLSGRPMCVNREMNRSDAFVAAWLPGSEGRGVADLLFGSDGGTLRFDFSGTLAFSWPKKPCQVSVNVHDTQYDPLFPFGYGLTYAGKDTIIGPLEEYTSEEYGCSGITIDTHLKDTVITVFDGMFDTTGTPWMGDPSNWSGREGKPGAAIPNLKVLAVADNSGKKDSALRFIFTGAAYWGVDGDEQDMSMYYINDYSLAADVRINKKPEGRVRVVVLCTYPCQDEVDITGELQAMPVGTWRELRIPLKKFKGADFLKISSRFQIVTTDAVDFSMATIRWEK